MSEYLNVGSVYIDETPENKIDGLDTSFLLWEYLGIRENYNGDCYHVFQCTESDYYGEDFQYFPINTPDKDFERWFRLSSKGSNNL